MVEIVIAFSKGDECSNHIVARRVAIIERLITEPVGKRVDAEGGLLHAEDAEDAAVDEATEPVAPAQTAEQGWEAIAHKQGQFHEVLVLPHHEGVLVEIRDVDPANALGVLPHQEPAHVRVEDAFHH